MLFTSYDAKEPIVFKLAMVSLRTVWRDDAAFIEQPQSATTPLDYSYDYIFLESWCSGWIIILLKEKLKVCRYRLCQLTPLMSTLPNHALCFLSKVYGYYRSTPMAKLESPWQKASGK